MAEFIIEHPSLKLTVRIALFPALGVSTIATNTGSAEKVAVVGLLVLFAVAVAVSIARRHHRDLEHA